MCVCVYVYICVHMSVLDLIQRDDWTDCANKNGIRVQKRRYACMYVCVCTCACMYVYMCVLDSI
jgi:hypothetical protein